MGIKDFSKTFTHTSIVTMAKLANKTIAIDAMTEIYRSALGAKSISTLTDADGNPTMHINVVLSVIVSMHKYNIKQIWCFDSPTSNKLKAEELDKRKQRKDAATLALAQPLATPLTRPLSRQLIEEPLDDLTTDELITLAETKELHIVEKKQSLEKQAFSVSSKQINEIKHILQQLNIMYLDAPDGFEGEQIASYLSATNQCDGVYSADTDCIAFGASVQWRRHPRDKKIYMYTAASCMRQMHEANPDIRPTLSNLRKACVMLGSDFAPKSHGIGPKTIFKKFDTVLTSKQLLAIKQFEKEPGSDITVFNLTVEAFIDDKRVDLIDWLVTKKSFSRTRMDKLLK